MLLKVTFGKATKKYQKCTRREIKNVAQTPDKEGMWGGCVGGRQEQQPGGWAQLGLSLAVEGSLLLCRWNCLWPQEARDHTCPRGSLPARPGAIGSFPILPLCLLCTIISPRQKQWEMGVRPADDPRANRKTAFASWTIYGSCLKHSCFCDARYNGYSSEEGILCTRDVLCLVWKAHKLLI